MDPQRAAPPPAEIAHPKPEGHPGDRVDGWKAIAGHLGRDIRTVQRWELSEHLPVHRLEHKQRATAYAFTGELDAWMEKRVASAADADAGGTGVSSGADAGDAGVSPAAPPARSDRWWKLVAALALTGIVAAGILAMLPSTTDPKGRAGDTSDAGAYSAFAEGSALYTSRQYRDAAIALERAVSRDPEYGLAWAWLAKTYARLSQPMWTGGKAASDRAAEAAERAGRLSPGIAETHVALALVARSRGIVEPWRAEAKRAIELDPRSAEAYGLLGDSYSAYVYACNRDRNPELAETYYRRAMELKPNLITTASNRADNLRRMGRYAECVELMDRTIRAFRDETPLVAQRGACRLLAGDIAGATEDLSSARGNPKLAPAGALVYLGLLELKTGRPEDGIRDLESVMQLDRSARSELIVAEAYGVGGDIPRATTHLRSAFDLDPSCARTVATSVAFKPIRGSGPVTSLLAEFGIR